MLLEKIEVKPKTSFIKRLFAKKKSTWTVTWGLYHDETLISTFDIKVKAFDKPHVWKILTHQIQVKPKTITKDK